eukprot:6071238-Amphidinium_carterae.1
MVQLLHLKAQRGVAVNPAIVFCTDFAADKDEEKVFELKILLMVLMLGSTWTSANSHAPRKFGGQM